MKNQIQVSTSILKQPSILLKLGQTVTVAACGNYWTRATVEKITDNEVTFSSVHVPARFSFKINSDTPRIPITSTLEGFDIIDYKGERRLQPCN